MKVYKQWLADENNNIVYKTLAEWAEYYGLKMVDGSEWAWMTRDGKHIDIEKEGGYCLFHSEFSEYADKLFFVGNADLDTQTIRIAY